MTFTEALSAAFPIEILIIFAVCLLLSAIGFYKFVYFLSVGYGFAVTGAGIAMIIMYGAEMDLLAFITAGLLIIYGIRLGGFLLIREIKSASYRKTLSSATKTEKPMPVFVLITIWICVAALYVMQVSPLFYRATNAVYGGVMQIISVAVMAIALIIETVADMQKSAAKKENPNRFCDKGLYKIVRCPNYFGEILFWTGLFISSFGVLQGFAQWTVAILGYILIVYVMLSGAKRLEKRQNKNYGENPEYQAYVTKTPIILPLIPLYKLENAKFIK